MSSGGLTGKVVQFGFWPSCHNCTHFAECAIAPAHPAYPHRWHWGKRIVPFADGTRLILESWVGTISIGQAHTGCYEYQVMPSALCEPSPAHLRYLELSRRDRQLEVALDRAQGRYDEEVEALYQEQFALWDEMDALTRGQPEEEVD